MRTLALLTIGVAIAAAQDADRPRLRPQPAASKDTRTGPEVGRKIPDFRLPDQTGTPQTFASLRGANGMLLTFVRSADWCPYCKTQLVDLNREIEAFRKQGLSIVSISYDTVAILKDFGTRQKIGFKMLSDEGSKVIRAFGIFNTNVEPGNPAYGIPFPGMYVVDANGVVKAKYFEDDYTERYSGASVLTREFGADGVEIQTADTKHLKLTSYASDAQFSPGRRITLAVEIEMKPKMHVYAPGIKGYIPIDWKMTGSPAFVAFDAGYPDSKMLHMAAIDETVPVYDGKIRILRDITIGNERELAPLLGKDRKLTIEGTFRYQACDDRQCFLPQDIPLKWTFAIGQMEFERVPAEIRIRP